MSETPDDAPKFPPPLPDDNPFASFPCAVQFELERASFLELAQVRRSTTVAQGSSSAVLATIQRSLADRWRREHPNDMATPTKRRPSSRRAAVARDPAALASGDDTWAEGRE